MTRLIPMLDDLLIAATCNPNVPGAIVAGLRQALDEARATRPSPTSAPATTPYRVCVKDHACEPAGSSVQIGQVVELGRGEGLQHPDCWVACDEGGWVVPGTACPQTAGQDLRVSFSHQRNAWRPLKKSEAFGCPAGTPGAKVHVSRLDPVASPWPQEAEPATVRVSSGAQRLQAEVDAMAKEIVATIEAINLPPPFDSMEEAQRAAGVWPAKIVMPAEPVTTHAVCVAEHIGLLVTPIPVGRVVELNDAQHPDGIKNMTEPDCWLPCDKDGWVSGRLTGPGGLKTEWRGVPGASDLRPACAPQFSALDEMAEQVARWAVPTREAGGPIDEPDDGTFQGRTGVLKPTNPKDAAATGRVPLGLLSPIAKAHWALAQHCGRAKYGAWNWREAGARASIYLDAIDRHKDGYLSGETYDPKDGTHHLGNIMACCAILMEAEVAGKLIDDRPPHLDMRSTYDNVERVMAELTAKYAHLNPKHWTR